MSDIATAPLARERAEEVRALMRDVYGEAPPAGEFEWWFREGDVVQAAEADGRLAGVLGASFYRAVVRGAETTVAVPLWAATDERFRGRGIFQLLNRDVERAARDAGATVMLGFTNRMAGPIYVSRLGWVDVERLRVWARPLSPLGRRDEGDAFGSVADTYARVRPELASHFVRDDAYVEWRYAQSPRTYAFVRSRNGYAIVGSKRLRGIDVAFVADLLAPTARETLFLLRRCARVARGARLLLALVPRHRRAHAAFGFVPTPMTIRLIGRALEGELPREWHFHLGDTDFF